MYRRIPARLWIVFSVGMILFFNSASPALAAQGSGNGWRPVYDIVMMYVNFAILVFVIVKYGSGPIKAFLDGRKKEISKQLADVEERKTKLLLRVKEAEKELAESVARFEKIKARYVSEGERMREAMIENAREQSRRMLEMEMKKAENSFALARKQFLAELVDQAVDFASSRISSEASGEDHEKILSTYVDFITKMAG